MATRVKLYSVKIEDAVASIKGLEVSNDVIIVSEIIYNDVYKKLLSLNKVPTLPFSLGSKVSVEDVQYFLTKQEVKFEIEDSLTNNGNSEKRILEVTTEQSKLFKDRIENEQIQRQKLTDLKFSDNYDEKVATETRKQLATETERQNFASSLKALRDLSSKKNDLLSRYEDYSSKVRQELKGIDIQISNYLKTVDGISDEIKKDYPSEILKEIESGDYKKLADVAEKQSRQESDSEQTEENTENQ